MMCRLRILLLLICYLSCASAYGQYHAATDSLVQLISKAHKDTNKVMLLDALINSLNKNATQERYTYAKQQLALSKHLNYKQGEAKANYNIGTVLMMSGNDSAALVYFSAALAINKDIDKKIETAACYSNMGQLYTNRSDPANALDNYLAALKILEKVNDKQRLGWCYNSLGSIYKGQHNYSEALKYDSLGLKEFEDIDDKKGTGSLYNSIGDAYENQGMYDQALNNYLLSLSALRELGDSQALAWPYYNIGEVYMLQKKYPLALTYYFLSLSVQTKYDDRSGMAWSYNNIGAVYLQQGKLAEAEQYCLKSFKIVSEINEIGGMKNAAVNLYKIYEARGDYRKALQYYKTSTALGDSLFNKDNIRKITQLQMQFDFDKRSEIAKAQQARKDFFTFGILALLLIIAVVILIVYQNQRKANRAKDLLLLQKEDALAQKEMLMKEVHHRVKNNLQVISSLLDLQLNNITDGPAHDAISESTARLKAISLIHQQLYLDNRITKIEFAQFASDLHTQVSAIFNTSILNVALHNNLPGIILDVDTAVPLGLILNELMTNSFKYAFQTPGGTIRLDMDKTGDIYTLRYADSGAGLPTGMDIKKLKSLGMTIIQSLSKQIGGFFSYLPETKTFIVTFREAADMKKEA